MFEGLLILLTIFVSFLIVKFIVDVFLNLKENERRKRRERELKLLEGDTQYKDFISSLDSELNVKKIKLKDE